MRREVLVHAYVEMKQRDEREFTPPRLDRAAWVTEAEKLSVGRQEKQRQIAEISKQLEEYGIALPE